MDEYLEEINSPLLISLTVDKEPYVKKITNDDIINLTGQSGSGKSYYAKNNFAGSDYVIVDTDDIFSDKRFAEATGINKELGTYFRNKYESLPTLNKDFDLIYKEITDYCKNLNKTTVIDCAQFHCVEDVHLLKGKIIIMRTCIDTCYNRTISRWMEYHPDYSDEELNAFKERKKAIYKWYKGTNKFIEKIDKI